MSEAFCVLVSIKAIQENKNFSQIANDWLSERLEPTGRPRKTGVKVTSLREFGQSSGVYFDLSDKVSARYLAVDFGIFFPESIVLRNFVDWVHRLAPYGKVGLLRYWIDEKHRSPPTKIDEENRLLSWSEPGSLPLGETFFIAPLDMQRIVIQENNPT